MSSQKTSYLKTRLHRILAGILEEWLTSVGIKVQNERKTEKHINQFRQTSYRVCHWAWDGF